MNYENKQQEEKKGTQKHPIDEGGSHHERNY